MKKFDSNAYWEEFYRSGKTCESVSCAELAQWKADTLNNFVEIYGIRAIVELGCGDGYQLSLYKFYEYVGFDVSQSAVQKCLDKFSGDQSKTFGIYRCDGTDELPMGDMTLSVDVLPYITDLEMLYNYLIDMFSHAGNWVVFYAWDHKPGAGESFPEHYQPVKFTEIIADAFSEWVLYEVMQPPKENESNEPGSGPGFYIYRRF